MESFAKMEEYEKIHKFMFPSGNVSVSDVAIKKTEICKPVIQQTASTVTLGQSVADANSNASVTPKMPRKQRRYLEKIQKKPQKKLSNTTHSKKSELDSIREQVKTDIRKAQFSEDDLKRIEKVLSQI